MTQATPHETVKMAEEKFSSVKVIAIRSRRKLPVMPAKVSRIVWEVVGPEKA